MKVLVKNSAGLVVPNITVIASNSSGSYSGISNSQGIASISLPTAGKYTFTPSDYSTTAYSGSSVSDTIELPSPTLTLNQKERHIGTLTFSQLSNRRYIAYQSIPLEDTGYSKRSLESSIGTFSTSSFYSDGNISVSGGYSGSWYGNGSYLNGTDSNISPASYNSRGSYYYYYNTALTSNFNVSFSDSDFTGAITIPCALYIAYTLNQTVTGGNNNISGAYNLGGTSGGHVMTKVQNYLQFLRITHYPMQVYVFHLILDIMPNGHSAIGIGRESFDYQDIGLGSNELIIGFGEIKSQATVAGDLHYISGSGFVSGTSGGTQGDSVYLTTLNTSTRRIYTVGSCLVF